MAFTEEVLTGVIDSYKVLFGNLHPFAQNFINLFLIVSLIFVYSVFIWRLHRFISTKNLLGLNLNQYNKSEFPLMTKFITGMFFFLEYVIVLPFLIFFWFTVFSLFLILLTKDLEINAILLVSAVIISAIRMASYVPGYGQKLSAEMAKLLPFTLLAVFLLEPNFFDFEGILSQLHQIPSFLSQVLYYLIFIMILEMVLRFFDFIFSLLGVEDEREPGENLRKEIERRRD